MNHAHDRFETGRFETHSFQLFVAGIYIIHYIYTLYIIYIHYTGAELEFSPRWVKGSGASASAKTRLERYTQRAVEGRVWGHVDGSPRRDPGYL